MLIAVLLVVTSAFVAAKDYEFKNADTGLLLCKIITHNDKLNYKETNDFISQWGNNVANDKDYVSISTNEGYLERDVILNFFKSNLKGSTGDIKGLCKEISSGRATWFTVTDLDDAGNLEIMMFVYVSNDQYYMRLDKLEQR